jgi:hypothetical protein
MIAASFFLLLLPCTTSFTLSLPSASAHASTITFLRSTPSSSPSPPSPPPIKYYEDESEIRYIPDYDDSDIKPYVPLTGDPSITAGYPKQNYDNNRFLDDPSKRDKSKELPDLGEPTTMDEHLQRARAYALRPYSTPWFSASISDEFKAAKRNQVRHDLWTIPSHIGKYTMEYDPVSRKIVGDEYEDAQAKTLPESFLAKLEPCLSIIGSIAKLLRYDAPREHIEEGRGHLPVEDIVPEDDEDVYADDDVDADADELFADQIYDIDASVEPFKPKGKKGGIFTFRFYGKARHKIGMQSWARKLLNEECGFFKLYPGGVEVRFEGGGTAGNGRDYEDL